MKEAPLEDAAASTDDFSPEALAALAESLDSGATGVQNGSALQARKPVSFKNGSVLGINIGADSIKAVELTAKNGSCSVTGIAIAPTPPDSIANGVVMSVNVLADAVKELIAPFKSRKAVTSVAGTGEVIVRVIEVPTMTDAELQENMKTDLDRYIPFPPSEVQWDAAAMRDLPTDPSSPNMDVLLVAARHELIELHLQLLEAIKVVPKAIDVEPLAVARALSGPFSESGANIDYNDVCAILNIGASSTEISILRGDELVFTRTVPIAGNTFTQALADKLNLSYMDAERLKREKGDASPELDGAQNEPATPLSYEAGMAFDSIDFADDATSVESEDSAIDLNLPDETETADSPKNASAAETSDPFDLDLFNSGPTQNEPDEQHQQKMPPGDESSQLPSKKTDDDNEPKVDSGDASLPSKTEEPSTSDAAHTASRAIHSFFDFEENELDEQSEQLPTIEGQPQHTEASPREDEPGTIDWDDDTYLPSIATTATSATLPSAFAFPESEVPEAGSTEKPTTPTATHSSDFSLVDTPVTNAKPATSAPPVPEVEKKTPTQAEEKAPVEDIDLSDILGDTIEGAAPIDIDEGLGGTITLGDNTDDGGLGTGLTAEEKPHDEAAVHAILKPILDDLASELRRSLEYHSARYPDAPVKRLVLIGGGAKMKNLERYFTQNLSLIVSLDDPFKNLSFDTSQANPQLAAEHGSSFAVALGLAMREIIR